MATTIDNNSNNNWGDDTNNYHHNDNGNDDVNNMSWCKGEELYSSMDKLIDISDIPTVEVVPDLIQLTPLHEEEEAEFDHGEETSALGAALSRCLSMG